MERLVGFPARALIVVGATTESDLKRLYEVIEDAPVANLEVLLLWPEGQEPPRFATNPAVRFHVWGGTPSELLASLQEAGAPTAEKLAQWAIRVGPRTVELSASEVGRIPDRFALLTERELAPPTRFEMADLEDFLGGSLENWSAYGVGLPVERGYTSELGLPLVEELRRALQQLSEGPDGPRTYILQLPSEGGAGATTILRDAAFRTAQEGYPALVLRPDQVDIDLEDLIAFTTSLSEAALGAGIVEVPPVVIVIDVEHAGAPRVRQLAQSLAAHGRRAVILQAVPSDAATLREQRGRNRARLRPLRATAEDTEIVRCEGVFRTLEERWALGLEVPSLERWRSYEAATRLRTPAGQYQPSSLFWVALRFFMTEGMELIAAERACDLLGEWVERRAKRISDPGMRTVINFVATLSASRIVSPLWTVLRPVTGGSFSSQLVDTLQQINDLVVWSEFSPDLQDQTLFFRHPVLAEEFLRRQGFREKADQLALLNPMLATLSPGHVGDMWVAEAVTASIAPTYEERRVTDWGWRLAIFEGIPPMVRESSKMILHHWARCLYLSADSPDLPVEERQERLRRAIDRLQRATSLPRRPGRDEHPSHLYNTLGTAWSRYARFLAESLRNNEQEAKAWEAACSAFEEAIRHSEGTNIEALLAFSQRLLTRWKRRKAGTIEASDVDDLAYALSLLDESEALLGQHENPDTQQLEQVLSTRADILNEISQGDAKAYIEMLKSSDRPDLGYYCQARLAYGGVEGEEGRRRALEILEEGEQLGIRFSGRSLAFLILLLSKHPQEQYNFPRLLRLYQTVEQDARYAPRALDAFRHAVLCYQVGKYAEGTDRFRRIRENARRTGTTPLRTRDLWRDPKNPSVPRRTQVRVGRVITEWRAEGFIDDFNQTVPLRPRHFRPPPKKGEVVSCVVRFEFQGPMAVPTHFEELGRRRPPS